MVLRASARRRSVRGMAMVEMVFVLPVLLMLVFGIAQLGLLFNNWLTLSNAVREGARAGIAWRTGCDGATVESEVRTVVETYTTAGHIDPVDVQVVGECGARGTPLTVTATYEMVPFIPFAAAIFGGDSITLSRSAAMANE